MAGQGSARVSLMEIDNSASKPVNRVLTGTPAGVIGRAKRGPAFVPTVFADIQEFQDIFGSFADKGLDSNSNLYGPLAVSEWMSGNPGLGAFVRLLGVGSQPGFIVGSKKLDNDGVLINNPFAKYSNTENIATVNNITGRTYLLGHFAKDKANSRYLTETSKSQEITLLQVQDNTILDALTLTVNNHQFTFDIDAISSSNSIIKVGNNATATAAQIVIAINLASLNITASSINDIITLSRDVIDISAQSIVAGGTSIEGEAIIKSQDASDSFALARGILMTPHGVVAGLSCDINVVAKNVPPDPAETALSNIDLDQAGYSIGNISSDLEFTIFLAGYTGQNNVITCSYDPSKSNYFYKVLNTDPHKIEELGHYLHVYHDISCDVIDILTDTADVHTNPGVAFCIPQVSEGQTYETFDSKFQTAVSPWVISQDFGLISDGSNNSSIGDGIIKLFRFHALDDGEIGNNQIKVLISNLTPGEFGGFGTFDVTLQKWNSNPLKSSILAGWKRLSLNVDADNYIARVIGDKRVYWDFDATKPGLQEEGSYPVTNKFVRVEVSGEVASGDLDASTLPAGFGGIKNLKFVDSEGDALFVESEIFEKINHFKRLQVPSIPFVRSIGKIVQTDLDEKEAKIIPWGVKFAAKENVDTGINGYKEYIEQTLNKSLFSYTKYFKNNWGPVIVNGSLTEELDYANDPNFFHLEKIAITHKGDAAKKIDNKRWGDAIFLRNSSLSSDTPPTGAARRFFRLNKDLSLANNKYLSFSFFMQGGFDGLDIFDEDKHYLKDAACYREGQTSAKTGPVIETYQQGIDVYADKAAANIQLLAVPGIRERIVTNYAIFASENRFDTMYIMDIEQKNAAGEFIINATDKPSVSQTIDELSGRGLDTSFAACFFPDVMLNKPNGGSMKVPPSIAALGVMSRADSGGSTPWYAPAGINRGLVENASATEFAIGREQLDELYDNDINPIYVPSGRDRVHIFGQKTLLKNPSAFDRINVRRLAIYIRRRIKVVADTFLFKLDPSQTLSDFSKAVEPILSNIQSRQGIEKYKVQIDTSTTTQADIENNTIRGKIYIQPTKSIEFISLDFVVSNSIE